MEEKINKERLRIFVKEKLENSQVLVIGDVMLDQYYYGEVKRISPEAPVPITRVTAQKATLGGAANVAHNLARLGCPVYLTGMVGTDYHRASLVEQLSSRRIAPDGLITGVGPTTTKLRVIGGHQQMLRLDFEEATPVSGIYEEQLFAYIAVKIADGLGSVIISDYAKGVCTPAVCQYIIQTCHARGIPVIVDPKGGNWRKYEGADYITPNLKELNEAVVTAIPNEDEAIKKAAQWIKRKYKIKNLLVTRSEQGLSLIAARQTMHIPTLAQEVFDVSGAGDTVIAVFSAALASGMKPYEAAYLANAAASVVVAKLGTYAISQEELLNALQT